MSTAVKHPSVSDSSRRQKFNEQGYLHVPGVFESAEVESLRAACARGVSMELLGHEVFREVLLDPRVVRIVSEVLGGPPVYFGDSVAKDASAQTDGKRGLHADSRLDDYDFKRDYPIVRVGLYLQDHDVFSGGLKLVPGSHKRYCLHTVSWKSVVKTLGNTRDIGALRIGRHVNVASKAGDLIVWSLRTHHSGFAVRPRFAPNLSLPTFIEDILPRRWHLPEQRERCVVFASYGLESQYLRGYLADRWSRDSTREKLVRSHFGNDEMVALAAQKGVTIKTLSDNESGQAAR